jgi:hypothetical protein
MRSLIIRINSDYLGITSSVLCLIHCLALPIIFVFTGYAGLNETHILGIGVDYIFAILALVAAVYTARHAHLPYIKFSLIIGWLLFISGILLEEYGSWHYLMHLGSATLIFSHYHNIRTCNRIHCDNEH